MQKSVISPKTEKTCKTYQSKNGTVLSIDIGGVTPLGGFHLQTGGQKMEIFLHIFGAEGAENVFFAAPKAPRKNFEHFFRNFWEIC